MTLINKEIIRIFLFIIRNITLRYPILKFIFLKTESHLYNPFTNFKEQIQYKLEHNQQLFENMIKKIRKYEKNYNFKGKVVLEIGPGNTLLLAIIFLLNGAKKVYLVDRFKQIFNDSLNLTLYKLFLKNFNDNNTSYSKEDFKSIKKKIIYFSKNAIENFNELENGSIDFIFSNAVLEHVSDLDLAIKKVSLLLKKDGYTFHYIDLKDHFHVMDKCYLNFLKYSRTLWNFIGDTNRLRYPDYILLFTKHKFEILEIEQNKTNALSKIKKIKGGFDKDFRDLSETELSILDFNVLAKKK